MWGGKGGRDQDVPLSPNQQQWSFEDRFRGGQAGLLSIHGYVRSHQDERCAGNRATKSLQSSSRARDGSDDGDGANFHGQKRSNKTHQSTTDPGARLYKKSYGKESKLSYLGHALVEKRNGLIATAMVMHADGYVERNTVLWMLHEKQRNRSRRITVGADKAYDTKEFVTTVRELNVTPHVTQNN